MKVVKAWFDGDMVGAALFDDGYHLVFEEKSAVLITDTGALAASWWKGEPAGAHYNCWISSLDGGPAALSVTEELSELIFDAGHTLVRDKRDATIQRLMAVLV